MWHCSKCGGTTFQQTLNDITEYKGCEFSELGHIKTWYKNKGEEFKVTVSCENCGFTGGKISEIGEWRKNG